MTTEELTQALTAENLRLATDTEAGWYYHVYDEENETTITVWVTDL